MRSRVRPLVFLPGAVAFGGIAVGDPGNPGAAAAVVPAPTLLPSAPHHDGHITTTERETMLDWIADPNIWASLLTLTFLEIVLGIDNIIFLYIIPAPVAETRRVLAQRLGLGLASFGPPAPTARPSRPPTPTPPPPP